MRMERSRLLCVRKYCWPYLLHTGSRTALNIAGILCSQQIPVQKSIYIHTTLCLKKNILTLKRYSSKLQGAILTKFGKKYSEYSRIEFVCFSFHVGLLFYQLFFFQSGHRKNMNFDAASSKCANFDEIQFFKHTPKLIIFGTHNLWTRTHNTLINELLLMLFYLFDIRPKLHHRK